MLKHILAVYTQSNIFLLELLYVELVQQYEDLYTKRIYKFLKKSKSFLKT